MLYFVSHKILLYPHPQRYYLISVTTLIPDSRFLQNTALLTKFKTILMIKINKVFRSLVFNNIASKKK